MTNLEWLLTLEPVACDQKYSDKYLRMLSKRETNVESATRDLLDWLASPHTEPIRLTPEERVAVRLLVDCGYMRIFKGDNGICTAYTKGSTDYTSVYNSIPAVQLLFNATWLTKEPLDLRELLKGDING